MGFPTVNLPQSAPLLLPPPRPSMREASNSRSGRWTDKEEKFARYIIQCYATGLLQLDHGVTLRSYLAKKLRCLPSRITKKFKGNDDSNIQGAQRSQKDTAKVSPHDIQIAQQNLLTLEKEFLQELTAHAAQASEVITGSPMVNLSGPSWQPDLSTLCYGGDGIATAVPTTGTSSSSFSPQRQLNNTNDNNYDYDASRDRLLNMSLGLNSILGSLLQRACTENHAIIQQQQTAETMNALVGAFASGQALSVLPLSPSRVAPPPTSTMIDGCWTSAGTAATGPNNNNNPMHYGSTHPSQLARVLTESLVSASTAPRGILPRPSLRFQPGHILHAPSMSTQTTTAPITCTNECTPSSSSAPVAPPLPTRRQKLKTPQRQVVAPCREETPAPRQREDMEDADAFLSFVQSVNDRSTYDTDTTNQNDQLI